MSQNLISLQISPSQLASVDTSLNALEKDLAGLIDLTTAQRSSVVKMGDKSEAFCRKALEVLNQNKNVLSANSNMDEMKRDLAMFDALRTRLVRLEKLHERLSDSQLALGSDVMSAALEGYAFLKIAGKGEGLDSLRRALSVRFNRSAKRKEEGMAPVTQ